MCLATQGVSWGKKGGGGEDKKLSKRNTKLKEGVLAKIHILLEARMYVIRSWIWHRAAGQR